MKFSFQELEQILDLSNEKKKQEIKKHYEKGAFDRLKFATKKECIIALQLNDALFENDPFYQCPFADYGDIYFDYFLVVNELMKSDRYKDIEETYRCLEEMHEYFGLSTRSKIYEAMVAVQSVLMLRPRELQFIEVD